MNDALVFFIAMSGLLSILIVYVAYKTGFTVKGFKDNWINAEGNDKPIWKGILYILGIPLLVGLLLMSFYSNAEASEINYSIPSPKAEYFKFATVFVGLDYTENASPFCEMNGINDRITSNMGFKQNLITYDNVRVNGKYTHHSCGVNPDSDASYDALGLEVEWVIW